MEILLGNKFLYRVNGHGIVDGTPGAGILAALVAHPSADCREGIVLFDQGQRLLIPSLGGQVQVALDGDMGRAGSFAGGSALVVAVFPVVVPVIRVPVLRPPDNAVGQLVLRVFHFPGLGAKLLSQLHRPGGAVFHALAAGHAVGLVHLGGVSAAGQVGGVEQLRGPQGVADVHIAVADAENLVFSVDVGDLVDEAILLGVFQNPHGLFICNIVALAGLPDVVGEVAHGDAPAHLVVRHALAHHRFAGPAGALAHADLVLILF